MGNYDVGGPLIEGVSQRDMADYVLRQPDVNEFDEDFAENMKFRYASNASGKQLTLLWGTYQKYRERARRSEKEAHIPFLKAWARALKGKSAGAYEVALQMLYQHSEKGERLRFADLSPREQDGVRELNALGLVHFIRKEVFVTLSDTR